MPGFSLARDLGTTGDGWTGIFLTKFPGHAAGFDAQTRMV